MLIGTQTCEFVLGLYKMLYVLNITKPFLILSFKAFLELATEEAAITMVSYYSAVTPHLRNQPIYIQYSNHKELKTDNTLNQVMPVFYIH